MPVPAAVGEAMQKASHQHSRSGNLSTIRTAFQSHTGLTGYRPYDALQQIIEQL